MITIISAYRSTYLKNAKYLLLLSNRSVEVPALSKLATLLYNRNQTGSLANQRSISARFDILLLKERIVNA